MCIDELFGIVKMKIFSVSMIIEHNFVSQGFVSNDDKWFFLSGNKKNPLSIRFRLFDHG